MSTRLRFQEKACLNGHHLTSPLVLRSPRERTFDPIISCIAQFPLELFQPAMMTLINHPEYNSSLILRSEVLSDDDLTHLPPSSLPVDIPNIRDHSSVRNIHRRLLPRRPDRDGFLDQNCTFYLSHDSEASQPSVMILTPRIVENQQLPYYHPAVSQLAFRYVSASNDSFNDGSPANHLVIEVIPLDYKPIDISSRLYRTCIALLETLDRYGWGALTNYRKRVHHDVLIPRNEYQDLYLVMKERYKSLVGEWKESTDPLKHVYEDVGIATFLMLLWKRTYNNDAKNGNSEVSDVGAMADSESRPWDDWARPPGGFVDVGCGNGILTHILLSAGYIGEGFDLRRRTSWSHYPESTQKHLHVQPFNPFEPHPYLNSGVFIIGNHADELTPWIPVVSTLVSASGYLSIPCCPWSFDTRYERGSTGAYHIPQYDPKSLEYEKFLETLGLGSEGETTYSKYRIWLGHLSSACGWKVECEMLRIPSTRNWAIIGREKISEDAGKTTAQGILSAVSERDIFKARTPEGKSN